jgi:hypothetical protein
VLLVVPSLASAAEPSLAEWARNRVEEGLVKPLARSQVRGFSRERPPPLERRVRVLQPTATLDKSGHAFVPFAVDVRFGDEWRSDIAGCVYQGSGAIFVKKGDSYRPASFLLGKKADPVAGVCEAAPSARS